MGKLTNLIGIIKDKVSQSKAAIVSKPNTISLHLALLRATTHHPFNPPNNKHLTTFLSFGHSSRATASAAIEALMDRLQTTRDASVAVKCLITVHTIIKRGTFILQDQLSIYPSTGGRNYLNLSNFRDDSSWHLSYWVRWYARYLEHLLSTSRVLGFFLCSISDRDEEKIASLLNSDLIAEIDSLVNLIQEMCKMPDSLLFNGNELVDYIVRSVSEDYLSTANEVSSRVIEFGERLSCLSFGESLELVCVLRRLEDCKEKLLILSSKKRLLIESFWGLTSELRDKIGKEKVYTQEDKMIVSFGRRDKASESARFGDRVMTYGDSLRFASARFEPNDFSLVVK